MEKRIRIPFISTINLFIETLTGTCFELRVSPFETILSVKAKIQRLEGIPISQQHLIWEGTELEDDFCLHDYRIKNDSTVRLVIALRGGPINTRRIAVDEPSFLEMADYIDANQEELLEELSITQNPGKNDGDSQVTLLVYRNGDQINFFRVIDRGDGSLTPISEPYRTKSYSEIGGEVDDVVSRSKCTMSRITENRITATKMKKLQSQMQLLKLKDGSPHKTQFSGDVRAEDHASLLKQKSHGPVSMQRRKISAGRRTPKLDQRKQISKDETAPLPLQTPRRPDVPAGKMRLPQDLHPKISFNRHDMYLRSYGLVPLQKHIENGENAQSEARTPSSHDSSNSCCICRRDSQIELSQNPGCLDASSSCHIWCRHASGRKCGSGQQILPDLGTYSAIDSQKFPETSPLHKPVFSAEAFPVTEDSQLPPISSSSLLGKKSLNTHGPAPRSGHALSKKPSLRHLQERSLAAIDYCTSLHIPKVKELRDSDHNVPSTSVVASNPAMGTKYYNHCDNNLSGMKKPRTPCAADTNLKNRRIDPDGISTVSCYSRNAPHCSSTLLPPVRPLVLKKKRCFVCGKKTGLATSYTCRCGENFCATHRYAETHDCTFDYKSSGRQLLKESNPIISAPKLPKI